MSTFVVIRDENGRVVIATDSQLTNGNGQVTMGGPKYVSREHVLFTAPTLIGASILRAVPIPPLKEIATEVEFRDWVDYQLLPYLRKRLEEQHQLETGATGCRNLDGPYVIACGGVFVVTSVDGGTFIPAQGWITHGSGGENAAGAIHALKRTGVCKDAVVVATLAVEAAIALDESSGGQVHVEVTQPWPF